MAVMTATRIELGAGCGPQECADFAGPLYMQLRTGYEECAVLPLPFDVQEWRGEHRTARKRADRAVRRGYRFTAIAPHERATEIEAINGSAPIRQGRPMSDGYRRPVSTAPPPDYPCEWHGVHPYGVEIAGTLVAYCFVYRAGQLALVSQILGHADHLEGEVMYLLAQGVVGAEIPLGGFLVYNRFDSGTDGLRFYKERIGFAPERVEWAA